MKEIVLLITVLVSFASFGQDLKIMDSAAMQSLKAGEFEYINISVEHDLVIEGKEDILIDLSSLDVPNGGVDSVIITFTKEQSKKTYTIRSVVPFLIQGIDSSVSMALVMYKDASPIQLKSSNTKKANLNIDYRDRPTFVSDTIVFGLLSIILALIFYTSSLQSKGWKKFYMFVPALLLCYLIPAILDSLGLISKEYSSLYTMAKNYLLPGALILMTLGIDFKGIINLGPKAIIMFLTATVGIIVGGPIAIFIYSFIDPEVVGGVGDQEAWRGFATLAGSWIGGGANQAAMLETYRYNPDFYGKMVTVDIVVANLWMAFLLWGAARADKFDKWLKADTSSIEKLKENMAEYQAASAKNPTLTDYMMILGITFGIVAFAHYAGQGMAKIVGNVLGSESPFAGSFFWLVVLATTGGLILSATKFRKYEGRGASKIGSIFIYVLVATIGMKMELKMNLF